MRLDSNPIPADVSGHIDSAVVAAATSPDRPSASGWTEIHPPFKLGSGAAIQFALFVPFSAVLVYSVGSLTREGGGGSLLFYLFICPGFFGLGWYILYLTWSLSSVERDRRRIERAARDAFERIARAYGPIRHLDLSLADGTLSGLALAGQSLLVLQEGLMCKVRVAEIRSWSWEIHSPAQIVGSGKGVAELRAKDERERERLNGFRMQTFDPDRPELHFRTSSEAACKRWEVVLENASSGRTAVD